MATDNNSPRYYSRFAGRIEALGGHALKLCYRLSIFIYMFADAFMGFLQLRPQHWSYIIWITTQQVYFTAIQGFRLTVFVGVVVGVLLAMPLVTLGIDEISFITLIYSELGYHKLLPILIAFIVIGRSGTAITTELGGFRIQQTLESIMALGIEPNHFIVLPRILGLSIAILLMCLWASVASVIATTLFCFMEFRQPPIEIIRTCLSGLNMADILVTGFMLICYATAISTVHAYYGFISTTSIELARNVPKAFVKSFTSCLVITLFFTLARGG